MPPGGYTRKHREPTGRGSTKPGVPQRSLAYSGVGSARGNHHWRGTKLIYGAATYPCCAALNLVQTSAFPRHVLPRSILPYSALPFARGELSTGSWVTVCKSSYADRVRNCRTSRARNVASDRTWGCRSPVELVAAWSVAAQQSSLSTSSISSRAIASALAPKIHEICGVRYVDA